MSIQVLLRKHVGRQRHTKKKEEEGKERRRANGATDINDRDAGRREVNLNSRKEKEEEKVRRGVNNGANATAATAAATNDGGARRGAAVKDKEEGEVGRVEVRRQGVRIGGHTGVQPTSVADVRPTAAVGHAGVRHTAVVRESTGGRGGGIEEEEAEARKEYKGEGERVGVRHTAVVGGSAGGRNINKEEAEARREYKGEGEGEDEGAHSPGEGVPVWAGAKAAKEEGEDEGAHSPGEGVPVWAGAKAVKKEEKVKVGGMKLRGMNVLQALHVVAMFVVGILAVGIVLGLFNILSHMSFKVNGTSYPIIPGDLANTASNTANTLVNILVIVAIILILIPVILSLLGIFGGGGVVVARAR